MLRRTLGGSNYGLDSRDHSGDRPAPGCRTVLKRVQASDQPLVVTQCGRAAAVILSVEAYQRGERQLLRLLVRGEQEITAGVGSGLDDVLADTDALLADGA